MTMESTETEMLMRCQMANWQTFKISIKKLPSSSATFQRDKGYWIAKPVASSRGRGIAIISHVSTKKTSLTRYWARHKLTILVERNS